MVAQPLLGGIDLARGLQFRLGGEQVVRDAERGEIIADHVHHRRDRAGAEQDQPVAFGRGGIAVAEFGGELLADTDEVFARIEPFGDGDAFCPSASR
jgi:hypothetical protein